MLPASTLDVHGRRVTASTQSSIGGAAPYSSSVTWSPPHRRVPLVFDLEHRDMRHEASRRGAMPVILAGLKEDAVAGPDQLDRPTAALGEADAFRLASSSRCHGSTRTPRSIGLVQPRAAPSRTHGAKEAGGALWLRRHRSAPALPPYTPV
jgi:hypothetical protein